MSSKYSRPSNAQPLVQELRDAAISQEFANNIGRRTFILTFPFPFLLIGKIAKVEADFLYILVETSQISEFEGLVACLNLNEIDVFFIEQDNGAKIPSINQRLTSGVSSYQHDADEDYEE